MLYTAATHIFKNLQIAHFKYVKTCIFSNYFCPGKGKTSLSNVIFLHKTKHYVNKISSAYLCAMGYRCYLSLISVFILEKFTEAHQEPMSFSQNLLNF